MTTREIVIAVAAGALWTVALTLAALIIGIAVGAVLCAMRTARSRFLGYIAAVLILTFRSVPPIVWLFLIFFGVGAEIIQVKPFEAAAIGLGLITGANLGEIFRGSFAAIHHGQWEAARALSLPPGSRFIDVIGPQLLRVALPSVATYSIGLLKDTAIASVIGVPEIAFQASHVSQRTYIGLEVFAVAGGLYILMSMPIAWLTRLIDRRLRMRVAR
jgi:polar amino acid transport system permease protein